PRSTRRAPRTRIAARNPARRTPGPDVQVPDSLLVAIGGNATHPENIKGTTEEQEIVADAAARALMPLIREKNRLLVTHGNGPVVGKILLRMMMTRHAIPPMRLDVCVAH